MWSFCNFYFFFHALSIGQIKFQKFQIFLSLTVDFADVRGGQMGVLKNANIDFCYP